MAFTPNERRQLELLAATVCPAGRLLPVADQGTVDRVERLLGAYLGRAHGLFPKLFFALDAAALARYGERFFGLPLGRRLEVLAMLERSEATRLLLRALLVPLKLAYFDQPEVYERLGCRFAVAPPAATTQERWQGQVTDAAELPGDEVLECEVVVVGTGAGGAPLAHALARRGHAVLLVEEGRYFSRRDFTGRPVEMIGQMYRGRGVTMALGNTAIPIPSGRGVGGTTLINSGTCLRAPDEVVAAWRRAGHCDFGPDELAGHFDAVEAMLQVGPSSPQALGGPARIIARGCEALGYSHHALSRNAPGCDGQGLCCFGCPTDAKRSTNLSYVPAALASGARLLTGLRVERVLREGDAAAGVEGVSVHGGASVKVRARVVVLACGTLLTPALLLRQGLANASGQLGRNLSIHPAAAGLGVFDESVNPSRSVPQGYAIDEFAREGLYFEGGTTPLELTAASLPGFGPSYVALIEQFDRTVSFGFMVKDSSRGRVSVTRDKALRLRYSINEADLRQVRRGLAILARVFFAAGAREVVLPLHRNGRWRSWAEIERFERSRLGAREVDLTAYHPLGTARMGLDPLTSVVGPTHETHDVHNLFVSDGSVVPGSLGVNPQITIMALALRAAEFVHRRVERLFARRPGLHPRPSSGDVSSHV